MGKGDNIADTGRKRLHNDASVCLALSYVKGRSISGSRVRMLSPVWDITYLYY